MNYATANHSRSWMLVAQAGVRRRMAQALVGQAVSLMVDAKTIAHGIVSDVLGAEPPQVVVGGMAYDVDQVLSHAPAALCQPAKLQSHTLTSTKY